MEGEKKNFKNIVPISLKTDENGAPPVRARMKTQPHLLVGFLLANLRVPKEPLRNPDDLLKHIWKTTVTV